jgi:hypothetical protein
MVTHHNREYLLKTPTAASVSSHTARPLGTKPQERPPISLSKPAAAQARERRVKPPAQRMAQKGSATSRPSERATAFAPDGLELGRNSTSESGFLPHASKPQNVANLFSKHIAEIRKASPEGILSTYQDLEPGFHLVFQRELCLSHDDLTPNDHKGKRALRLNGHEKLVQAVASPEEALKVLARLLEKGRVEAVRAANKADNGRHATKPLVIDVLSLVAGAKQSSRQDIELHHSDHGMAASWKAPPIISFKNLEEIRSLKNPHTHPKLGLKQPLGSCAFLGGGGGSDVIQAAALAKLFQRANPVIKVLAVISIRTLFSKSTSAGEKRSVWDPNDKTNSNTNLLDSTNGDLKIESHYRGNGRFVEDAIAGDFRNVRLVIDDKSQDNLRGSRYQGAIGKDVDSMIVIDTGGDVLGGMYPSAKKKTPDQDCRTQLATAQIAAANDLNSFVAIAALGVDAPPDAQAKLQASQAVYYRFTAEDRKYLRGLYSKWQFDGTPANLKQHPERYGKTPLAMLASFDLKEGESGYHALPLPESVIDDFSNPWTCITWITPEMGCLVLANQARLMSVIAPQKKSSFMTDENLHAASFESGKPALDLDISEPDQGSS